MENVKIDGEWLKDIKSEEPGDNYIEMEPVTGLTTKFKRSYTMVYSFGVFNETTKKQLPFPTFDNFVGKKFPLFNVTEEITVDYTQFYDSVSYISESHNRIYYWSLWLTIVCFVCVCLASCFQCVYLMNTPVEQKVSDRLLKLEQLQGNQTEVVDDGNNRKAFFTL